MEFKDYYSILGVKRDAAPEAIKTAYRKLARKYHPDVSKEPNAETRFKEVGEAYEVLKDPQKRSNYDQLGSQWQQGQEFKPPPGWQGAAGAQNFDFGGGGYTEVDPDQFSDFFSSLFGGGQRFSQGHAGRGRTMHRRGEDIHSKIKISLPEAYAGSARTLQLAMPELNSHGQVETKTKSLKVKIPAGVIQGQQIRLSGQGSPGMGGGAAGDLYLEIEFEKHPVFHFDKADILLTLPITLWEAGLGSTITVPTLGGKVDLKIPAGAQSAQKLRLKGRGLPAKTPGDQYIILEIATPKAETEAARELYEQMAKVMPFNPRKHLEAIV